MLNFIITWSLQNRLVVVLAWLGLLIGGVFALRSLAIDAFPDSTPAQVQINTAAPSLDQQEVEKGITMPLEQSISGLPNLKNVRSISKFGLSQIIVTFEDGTDILSARALLNERLTTARLPADIPRPQMGPITTGLGEVLHYAVVSTDRAPADSDDAKANLMWLRTFHDWSIRPVMRTVPGVAEINSWGGLEKQYQVRIDPDKLIKFNITFKQVEDALMASNFNVGGGMIRDRGEALTVHGLGKTSSADQLGSIVVDAKGGTPILLRQLGEVKIGNEIRRGAVTLDGKGEVVLGLGFMMMGENSHDVTRRMTQKLTEVESNLPPDVKIIRLYDRTELVDHVIATVRTNLFEGGLLVIAVLFIFLGNLRAGLIVALAIPFSMIFAFAGMWKFAIAGSLLSLGALDFGLVVDSSVVLVENCVSKLSHHEPNARSLYDIPTATKLEVIRDAAVEVRKPTLFGELIILLVYIPILTLGGVAGQMFRPMALTVIFALIGSLCASLTLMPVLASLLPRRMQEKEPLPVRAASWIIMPLFRRAWRYPLATFLLALTGLVCAVFLVLGRGQQFMPELSEGAMVLNVKRLIGVDIDEVIRRNSEMEKLILEKFPTEVEHVWSRCGVAEVATDPMGIEETDMFITLKPRQRWRAEFETQEHLKQALKKELDGLPGQSIQYEQPIAQRVNEMTSGVKSKVAVKVYGDDFEELTRISQQIKTVIEQVNPTARVSPEQLIGAPVLEIEPNLEAMAHYNLPARTVLDYVEAIGSKPAGDVLEGAIRFPLIIRLSERWRSKEEVGNILIPTPRGEVLPLARVTRIRQVEGPALISHEWGQRRTVMPCEVDTDDVAGFVAEARRRVNSQVNLPATGRYRIEWSGNYEYWDEAMARLWIFVPMALLGIFMLLYLTFHNIADAIRIYTGIPFALIGGVAALALRDMPLSVSAAVGFIAVSGVSVLNGLLLVTFIRHRLEHGSPMDEAVCHAVRARLRPVLMTALVASLGFVPMALSTGMGAEVQRPLATVVIGGVISSTMMTLLVLPVVYHLRIWRKQS
jgi:cobalt-zinc-cadmium resistance protein CzcA